MRRLVACLAVCGVLLAACADDEPSGDVAADHPALLQADDLPAVESVHVAEGNSNSKTPCAAMDREYNLAITGRDDTYLEYRLDNGDLVKSAVQWPRMQQETIDHTFAELRTMIDTCTAEAADDGSFEELTGLPEGAIGFRATQDTSDGAQTTERGYVKVDDERAAVVTVIHTGDGTPSVRAADLLPIAAQRASDG